MSRTVARLTLALLAACAFAGPAAAAPPPANPGLGPTGTSAMHGDSGASDTSPLPGPAGAPLSATYVPLGAACPSILIGRDEMPVALCTAITTRAPVAYLLDPRSGLPLASLALPKGNLFSGVYPYLDDEDRLVFADGRSDLVRIAHDRDATGRWRLRIVQSVPLGPALAAACGSTDCGGVVGLAPDWRRRVWFATDGGVAGLVDRDGTVRTLRLGTGEHVANSIATAPGGTAVATDHALYYLAAKADGRPAVVWRDAYDRGPARKPGQLSRGTGSTPTFFGPATGWEYLAIVDNAAPTENLLVYDVRRPRARPGARRAPAKRARRICRTPVLTGGGSGSENSPIGSERTVVVASTYGYPYPATPDSAGPAVPATAAFSGGMTRVDVAPGGRGCTVRWTNAVRSAAVPKLSLADGAIHTVARSPLAGSGGTTGPLDRFAYTTVDADTGRTLSTFGFGASPLFDTLQLAGTTGPGRVLWQGTITGLVRIARR